MQGEYSLVTSQERLQLLSPVQNLGISKFVYCKMYKLWGFLPITSSLATFFKKKMNVYL